MTSRPKLNVKEQIDQGVNLSDLELPAPPRAEVIQWGEGSPLDILVHEALSEYAFRWLNPIQRERDPSEGWKYVQGDLAKAVRRCGVVQNLVGGDNADDLIRNGDLILGWMPRAWAEARKRHFERKNAQIREAVTQQKAAEADMKKGPGSEYIRKEGSVTRRVGPMSEG